MARRRRDRQPETTVNPFQADLDALRERVLGNPDSRSESGEPVDVAEQVRRELARQRVAEAKRCADAEAARFRGGPCQLCGGVESREDVDGEIVPGWRQWRGGPVDVWCYANWVMDAQSNDDVLDQIAAVLLDRGLPGLRAPVIRSIGRGRSFRPGLAAEVGVRAWADTPEATPGESFAHLAGLAERYRAEQERARIEADRKRAEAYEAEGRRRADERAREPRCAVCAKPMIGYVRRGSAYYHEHCAHRLDRGEVVLAAS